jgi:hypothetical protein
MAYVKPRRAREARMPCVRMIPFDQHAHCNELSLCGRYKDPQSATILYKEWLYTNRRLRSVIARFQAGVLLSRYVDLRFGFCEFKQAV